MRHDTQARLADLQAALVQDRQTFERQVSAVFDRLTADRLHLAEEHRRLLTDRKHLVLVGKRLRKRWLGQKKTAERESREKETLLSCWTRQLEVESAKLKKHRLKLKHLRYQLAAEHARTAAERRQLAVEQQTLNKQRAELVAWRGAIEAECRKFEERRSQLAQQALELEGRVQTLSLELGAAHLRSSPGPRFPDGSAQKVA
jgi:transcription initiation factor TFIID subunit TAF12